MALFALSDLHLSFHKPKPMDVFGANWKDHFINIETNWRSMVSEQDTVLVCGDISWAMSEQEAVKDLLFLNSLPGKKMVISGNHDFWWASTARLNEQYNNTIFLKNTATAYSETVGVCGTRGWLCPNDTSFTPHDEKIYKREVNRLQLSLAHAMKQGFLELVVMLHFPPTNDKQQPSGFTELINQYPVTEVIYGHLHGNRAYYNSLHGVHQNILYRLVSADFLNFKPVQLLHKLD